VPRHETGWGPCLVAWKNSLFMIGGYLYRRGIQVPTNVGFIIRWRQIYLPKYKQSQQIKMTF
jgi:hypothetical protein